MFSSSLYRSVFGSGWHPGGRKIEKLLTYATYAGDPTNNVVPDHIGQQCFDTANSVFYIATGTTSADWAALHS